MNTGLWNMFLHRPQSETTPRWRWQRNTSSWPRARGPATLTYLESRSTPSPGAHLLPLFSSFPSSSPSASPQKIFLSPKTNLLKIWVWCVHYVCFILCLCIDFPVHVFCDAFSVMTSSPWTTALARPCASGRPMCPWSVRASWLASGWMWRSWSAPSCCVVLTSNVPSSSETTWRNTRSNSSEGPCRRRWALTHQRSAGVILSCVKGTRRLGVCIERIPQVLGTRSKEHDLQ